MDISSARYQNYISDLIDKEDGESNIILEYKDKKTLIEYPGTCTEALKNDLFIGILHKYYKINRIAKNAILENYKNNDHVKRFFDHYCMLLNEEDLIEIVEKMEVGVIHFFNNNINGDLEFAFGYFLSDADLHWYLSEDKDEVSEDDYEKLLYVFMDEKYQITTFDVDYGCRLK